MLRRLALSLLAAICVLPSVGTFVLSVAAEPAVVVLKKKDTITSADDKKAFNQAITAVADALGDGAGHGGARGVRTDAQKEAMKVLDVQLGYGTTCNSAPGVGICTDQVRSLQNKLATDVNGKALAQDMIIGPLTVGAMKKKLMDLRFKEPIEEGTKEAASEKPEFEDTLAWWCPRGMAFCRQVSAPDEATAQKIVDYNQSRGNLDDLRVGIIERILRIITSFIGGIAVIVVVFHAGQLLLAAVQGDSDAYAGHIKSIVVGLSGLVLVSVAYLLVTIIIGAVYTVLG